MNKPKGIKMRGRKPSLKAIRIKLGYNQTELAKKLGLSQGMISLMESGKAQVGENVRKKMTKLSAR
jgi:transcriptional regulator with XRE-family HTH domain